MNFRKAESLVQDLALLLPSPLCLCSPQRCRCCASHCGHQLPSPPSPGAPVAPLLLRTVTLPLSLPSSSRSPWTLQGHRQQKVGVPMQTSGLSLQGPIVPKGWTLPCQARQGGGRGEFAQPAPDAQFPPGHAGRESLTPNSGSRLACTHRLPGTDTWVSEGLRPAPSPARRSLRWSMRSRLSSRLSTCALIWLSSPLMECSSSARTAGKRNC